MIQIKQEIVKLLPIKKTEKSALNTSIQHLYYLLSKNSRKNVQQVHPQSSDTQRPNSKLYVSIKYSSKQRGQSRNEGQNAMPKISSPARRNSLLQNFYRKINKDKIMDRKKNSSIENTNKRLKSIILGRKQQNIQPPRKKGGFYSTQDARSQNSKEKSEVDQKAHHQARKDEIKFSKQDKLLKADLSADKRCATENSISQLSNKIGFEQHLDKLKQSLRIITEQSYSKRMRFNKKFLVNGLSVLNSEKKVIKIHPNQKTSNQPITQIISQDNQIEENNWDQIISTPSNKSIKHVSIIKGKKKNLTISKLTKKSSIELFQNKIFPDLLISEHIIWKLDQMFQFYSLVLLSFACKNIYLLPRQLPRFHKKEVKYAYYVGFGNNRSLISDLMSKRWWWRETNNLDQANFVWTQHKVKSIFKKHEKGKIQNSQLEIKHKSIKLEKIKQKLNEARKVDKNKNLFLSFSSLNGPQQFQPQCQILDNESLLHNHLMGGNNLGDKKSLFNLLKCWVIKHNNKQEKDLFSFIPLTYHIQLNGNPEYQSFKKAMELNINQQNTLWIVKPAENSNRGRGIFVSNNLSQIEQAISNRVQEGGTTIIQKYISDLLLYYGRKFDIRVYLLCITIKGVCKYYWFSQGYIRTSSCFYSIKELNTMIHLTNDAIQNQGQQYGRYEKGNKISFAQLQSYLDEVFSEKKWKIDNLVKKMKSIAKQIALASYPIIDSNKKSTGFQLFGMDFLIDTNFNPWLLEVNTNPCLQTSSPLLQKLIPRVVQNVIRLAVDPLFPPCVLPCKQFEYSLPDKMLQWNKFELIFDSLHQKDTKWQKLITKEWFPHKIQQIQPPQ